MIDFFQFEGILKSVDLIIKLFIDQGDMKVLFK